MSKEPYILINVILGGVLALIFIYSFLFPWLSENGATVPSSCEGMPAAYCKSRGLSRAFAAMMKGDAESARQFNAYSIPIFFFFLSELAGRIVFSILYWRLKKDVIIYGDAVIAVVGFLLVALPMVMP